MIVYTNLGLLHLRGECSRCQENKCPGPGASEGARVQDLRGEGEQSMIIAGVVIETAPGRAVTVAQRLRGCRGIEICGNDGSRRLAGVWEAASSAELERSARELVRSQEDILGVYPTLVAEDF